MTSFFLVYLKKQTYQQMNLVQYDGERAYVQIPLTSRAYQFYINKYGQELTASCKQHPFFHALMGLTLERNQYGRMVVRHRQPMKKLTVYIPDMYKHSSVDEKRINRITHFLEENMEQHLSTWIASAYMTGISESQAAKNFMAYYQIDDWDMDSARMKYRRSSEFEKRNKILVLQSFS